MNYIYTPLKNTEYEGILTMLDYEDPVMSCVFDLYQKRNIPSINKTILIDALLRVGNDKFRFISFKNSTNGNPHFKYRRDVNKDLIEKADNILKEYPETIRNSILPSNKKGKFLEDWVYCNNCNKFFKIDRNNIWTDIVVGDSYHGSISGEFVNCPKCNKVIELIPYMED